MSLSRVNIINDTVNGLVVPPPRIVGGYDVSPPYKYPALVAIYNDDQYDCGGTLWDGNTIITAAHCSENPLSANTVKVHRHDLSKSDEQENGKTYKVLSRIIHPKFIDTKNGYDVAIWKIDAPAGCRTQVELDDGTIGNVDDTLLTTIGWGLTVSGPATTILQEVKVPVYNFEQCQMNYYAGGRVMTNLETQICAGYPEGKKDACTGDSGSPLFIMKAGKQVLVGLTSHGIGCASPKFPGVYARVSALKEWILENV